MPWCAGRAPMLQSGLELDARSVQIAHDVQRSAQNGMGQRDSGRILDGPGNGPAARCVMQRGFEIAAAEMEHVEQTQQPHLVEGVAAVFRDRQAPVQGRPRRFAFCRACASTKSPGRPEDASPRLRRVSPSSSASMARSDQR